MRRPWTLLVTAMFGLLLALAGQHAAQAASGDGVITGTVTGGGQPLSSVSVNITESGGQGHYYYGYTGQDGKFTIPNVADGTYKVQYSAPYGTSYLGEWFDDKKNSADATPVTVTNGATVTANASLATGGRVTGRITADQGGAGLSGAYVYVYDATTTSGGSTAYGYAGADGTFTTTAVPTGRYKVQIYAPYQSRYLDEWYDNKTNWNNATEITVTAGADTTVNAGLAEGSQIKGTVTAQTGGQPISSGTYVYVYNRDNSWNSVASGYVASDGKYTTHALPPGDYKVQFYTYASEYLGEWFDDKGSFDDATIVRLQAGQDATANAALAKGSHITGRVTGPDSTPVSARVQVRSTRNQWDAYTDADGRYDIGRLPRGRYTVQFRPNAPTELVQEWWNDQRDADSATPVVLGTEQTSTADARLERGGVITGTVRDPQSQPVAGATVRAKGMQTTGATVLTDANGQYRITGLEAGDYKVRIKPIGGFAGQWYQGVDTSDKAALIRVGLGQTRSGIDATLRAARTIGGTVVGADGLPVEDARVEVYARGATYYSDATYTDAQGAFRTHDLPAGSYQVQIRPAAPTLWASEWYNNAATRSGSTAVTISQSQSPTIAVALRQGGRISGTLTKADGTPLAGADVEARSNREYRYAETDGQGRYEVTGLSTGEYTVNFRASGFLREWYDNAADEDSANPVSVTTGQTTAGIDAQLVRGATISGTVRANGSPVSSYTEVAIYREGDRWEWDEVETYQGQYSFQGLPPGDYKVQAYGSGEYVGQWWPSAADRETATAIHVNAGQDVTGRDFALAKGGSISGTVNGPDGNPLQWGYVNAYGNDEYPVAYGYIQQGAFQMVGLRAGTYRLQFQATGLLPEWWQDQATYDTATPITVTNGQNVPGINVQMERGGKIRGVVRDGQANPLDACVDVLRAVDDARVGSTCTNDSGNYVVSGLPTGRYVVRFNADSRAFATQWWNGAARRSSATVIDLPAGSEAVADATMRRGGTLTGLITDQQSQPVGGVQIRAYSDDGYEYGLTDSLGRYTFTGLDEGDYRIEAVPGAARLDLLKEWYNNAATRETATVLPVGNGQTVTASMQLEQGALVSGVVTDADGPVAGIGVDVFDLNGNKSLTAWTDANGKYTSSALSAGEYKVRFMPGYYGGEGLVEQWWEDRSTEATARIVNLDAHEQKTGVNARLRSVGNATVPGAPTAVTATAGDGTIVLQWQAPANDGGLPITRYRVEGDPDGGCQTLGTLHCTIEGLESGQSYTFRVYASNSVGLSAASAPSNPGVPFGKPKPPTAVTATAGQESAAVAWTPGSANGRPITSYTATAAPGGRTCVSETPSCTVTGLTAGTSYTFTVTAVNEAGRSQPSDPSAAVIPTAPPVTPPPPPSGGQPPAGGTTPVAPPTAVAPALAAPQAPAKPKLSVKKRKLKVAWSASAGATSYRVLIAPASKPGKGKWKTVSKPSFQSGKLKKGKYVVQVKAVGLGGESAVSKWKFKVK